VSLRDLPATVADLAGLGEHPPSRAVPRPALGGGAVPLARERGPAPLRGRHLRQGPRQPLARPGRARADEVAGRRGEGVYPQWRRPRGAVRPRQRPLESHNLATTPDADPTLRRFRATLGRILKGDVLPPGPRKVRKGPGRFSPNHPLPVGEGARKRVGEGSCLASVDVADEGASSLTKGYFVVPPLAYPDEWIALRLCTITSLPAVVLSARSTLPDVGGAPLLDDLHEAGNRGAACSDSGPRIVMVRAGFGRTADLVSAARLTSCTGRDWGKVLTVFFAGEASRAGRVRRLVRQDGGHPAADPQDPRGPWPPRTIYRSLRNPPTASWQTSCGPTGSISSIRRVDRGAILTRGDARPRASQGPLRRSATCRKEERSNGVFSGTSAPVVSLAVAALFLGATRHAGRPVGRRGRSPEAE
jgi:hypothetical protein